MIRERILTVCVCFLAISLYVLPADSATPRNVEDFGVAFKLECIRASSGWQNWSFGQNVEAPMPDEFVGGIGADCDTDFYDRNSVSTGGSVLYRGASVGNWSADRKNCSVKNGDGGISKGQVVAEYCRVVPKNAEPYSPVGE